MKAINISFDAHPEILKSKLRYGFFYGALVGLLFTIAVWGADAYTLYQAHGLQAWLKFIVGIVLCVSVGAIAGGLSAKLDKIIYAFILWVIVSVFFA